MRCTSPRTVGFLSDGKTICWSQKHYSKEFATFQLPCKKCLSCRLENAREKAIRCVHEASLHEKNSFITLTYSDENLKSNKLVKTDIDNFIKRLRDMLFRELLEKVFPNVPQKKQRKLWRTLPKESQKRLRDVITISVFGSGEYGERGQRPHWHLLIFNWRPTDAEYLRKTDRGDKIFKSKILDTLWGQNDSEKKPNEIGDVTFESAGYCARYATKKLTFGHDDTHDFEPIPLRSSANAIGKKWIEKFHEETFNNGFVLMEKDGNKIKSPIPRYYEDWYKLKEPDKWRCYVTQIKPKIMQLAAEKEEKISLEEKKINMKRSALRGLQISRNESRKKILESKFKQLVKNLKL